MKNILRWCFDNTLVAVGLVAASAVTAGIYQAQEVGIEAYRLFAEQWAHCGPLLRQDLAAAMADGRISRWESAKLMRELREENRVLVYPAATPGRLQQERDALRRKLMATYAAGKE